MLPIQQLPREHAKGIRYVLFDIDDTITEKGRLLAESYEAMWRLKRCGYVVIPVTGRPAGWCDLIARQWPVDGVIGENGAFAMYLKEERLARLYHPNAPEPNANAARLLGMAERALARFEGLRVAKDQAFRLFDVALDFAEEEPNLGLAIANDVRDFCVAEGAVAKISSIHVNAWFGAYDKLSMAEYFLSREYGYDPIKDIGAVLYFGDSPNDEPMFSRFPLSCGVANVQAFASFLKHPPRYVAQRPFGYGFAEGCSVLMTLAEKI